MLTQLKKLCGLEFPLRIKVTNEDDIQEVGSQQRKLRRIKIMKKFF